MYGSCCAAHSASDCLHEQPWLRHQQASEDDNDLRTNYENDPASDEPNRKPVSWYDEA
jgi:hypothetical protein